MTDNEIIKAFEVCFGVENCKGCPLCDEEDCPSSFQLITMVLDLINRQQAEISVKRKLLEKAEETIGKQQAEIEELKIINEHLATFNIENEAEIKEKQELIDRLHEVKEMVGENNV